jgi:hypothetical protein
MPKNRVLMVRSLVQDVGNEAAFHVLLKDYVKETGL